MKKLIYRILWITLAIVLCALLYTSICQNFGLYNSSAKTTQEVQYKVHVVEAGDTLWGIAKQYPNPNYRDIREYIYDIKQFNKLNSSNIIQGQVLKIPQ